MSSDPLTPRNEHRFAFALWTVGNPAVTRSARRRGRRSTPSRPCIASPSMLLGVR
jgi:hypothetical protein